MSSTITPTATASSEEPTTPTTPTTPPTPSGSGHGRVFASVSEQEAKEFLAGYYRRTEPMSSVTRRPLWYFWNLRQYVLVPFMLTLLLASVLLLLPTLLPQQTTASATMNNNNNNNSNKNNKQCICQSVIQKSRLVALLPVQRLAWTIAHMNQTLHQFQHVVQQQQSMNHNISNNNKNNKNNIYEEQAIHQLVDQVKNNDTYLVISFLICGTLLWIQFLRFSRLLWWLFRRVVLRQEDKTPVYLLDFATLKSDDCVKVQHDLFMRTSEEVGKFTKESLDFQHKILTRGCISQNTAFPPTLHELPPRLDIEAAREEATYVFRQIVGDLLSMTGLKPTDIDILIVNCSLFCPTPSLSAMIINMFGMRDDIKSFNLGGMGCSAGLVSIDLAKDLLQVHKNARCLVVSTENITQNWYLGNDRSMLLSNCLFRMGGAAILLTNMPSEKYRSKYELVSTVRVHRAKQDVAYNSVYQTLDADKVLGVRLSEKLISVAGEAVVRNLTTLLTKNPWLIPLSELVPIVWDKVKSTLFKGGKKRKPYTPNFGKIFDHFAIHAGGRKVLDDIGVELQLKDKIKPSRAALYSFGNTSSASTWYELEFIENSGLLHRDQNILMMAFGSGFKCNSVVWKSL